MAIKVHAVTLALTANQLRGLRFAGVAVMVAAGAPAYLLKHIESGAR